MGGHTDFVVAYGVLVNALRDLPGHAYETVRWTMHIGLFNFGFGLGHVPVDGGAGGGGEEADRHQVPLRNGILPFGALRPAASFTSDPDTPVPLVVYVPLRLEQLYGGRLCKVGYGTFEMGCYPCGSTVFLARALKAAF
ncbi:hypothetical protein VNI00_018101 [Paramarasmius palmivorus]|uniref:Uncharacterized protein n=1 Tax=Paramarasmius palmivorus TaxID=297713 RepID=A0AAW0B0B6_9AGAR